MGKNKALYDFANAESTIYLIDPTDQNQFAVCGSRAAQIPLQASGVTANTSFVDLALWLWSLQTRFASRPLVAGQVSTVTRQGPT